MDWHQAVDRVSKCVFRIVAGNCTGTGFLVALGRDGSSSEYFGQIATCWHVVADLVGTARELEIIPADSSLSFSTPADQIGFYPLGDVRYDTALIVVRTGKLFSENDLLPLYPYESMVARGAEIGWLGFPGIVEPQLCFFHGHISGYLNEPPTYLVDGVAINGVSGGPAFDDRCHVIGIVSSYRPNQLDEHTTLPGLTGVVPIGAVRYWMEHRIGARVLRRSDLYPTESTE